MKRPETDQDLRGPVGRSAGFGVPRGSGGQRKKKPKQTKESGSSSSFVRLEGVLSYGPIEGVIGGLAGVYLDDTPVESGGTRNFEGVTFAQTYGEKNQAPLKGFGGEVSTETSVGLEVRKNIPITRSIVNPNIDFLRVKVGLQLQEFPDDGGYRALRIEYKIYIKTGLGPFVEVLHRDIKERYASMVELEYSFPVNNSGGTVSQFQVRVERITNQDTNTVRYQRILTFRSYGESISSSLVNPYLAKAGLQLEASQFSSIPRASFLTGGRKILIPSNATVAADRGLDYSGPWNGTFIEAPKAPADPAWVFYDMCINNIYGFGRLMKAESIDKWALYSLSQYCNELLVIGQAGGSGGGGIYERRYQLHAVINSLERAWELLSAVTSIFRGWSYWLEAAVVEADRPTPVTAIISHADVVDGKFSYTSSHLDEIYTVAYVSWVNPQNNYKQEVEVVTDPIGVARYGRNVLRTTAFACVSQTQAHRLGWAYLISARLEQDVVRFRIRGKGLYFRPGQCVEIMDLLETELRYSGVVKSATAAQIELDRPVVITAGLTHRITVTLPDGTIARSLISNAAGTHSTLNLSQPTPIASVPGATWTLSNGVVEPQVYRLKAITPVEESADPLLFEVVATQHVEAKYNIIDTDYYVPPRPPVPTKPPIPDPPTGVQGQLDLSAMGYLLSAYWTKPASSEYVVGYLSRYRADGGEWSEPVESTHTSIAWDVLENRNYEIEVASFDLEGKTSGWVPATISAPVNISTDYSSLYTLV